jgi:hypothetical protein
VKYLATIGRTEQTPANIGQVCTNFKFTEVVWGPTFIVFKDGADSEVIIPHSLKVSILIEPIPE